MVDDKYQGDKIIHKVAHYKGAMYPDVAGCIAQYANT